jgi:hypothetical protein
VIGLPPLFGATNATVMRAFPGVTVGAAGAAGTPSGTVCDEGGDGGLSPLAFVAITVHV